MSIRIGDYIRTIPEIQAIDMANKAQLADNIAYFKKSQQYDTGNILESIRCSITPEVCKALNPPLNKNDFAEGVGTLPKINQYILMEIMGNFKQTEYYEKVKDDAKKIDKAVRLWWAWDGRDVTERVKTNMVKAAKNGGKFRDDVKSSTSEAFSEYKTLGEKCKFILDQ